MKISVIFFIYYLHCKYYIQIVFLIKRGYKSDMFTGNISRKSYQIGKFFAQIYASKRVGLVAKCTDQLGRN